MLQPFGRNVHLIYKNRYLNMKKTMQRLGVAAMVAVMAVMGTGCVYSGALTLSEQDKKVVSKTIPVKQFDHLDVATGINVTYTPGATREMKVTAPACLMERLEVKQEGGKLKLKLKSRQYQDASFSDLLRKLKSEDGVKVQLSSPSLKEIETSSGASVKAVSLPNVYELEFSASSGSEIEIGSLEAGKFEADASSGAVIKVKAARVNDMDADASSGAEIKISGIKAVKVEADASSGAEIELAGEAQDVDFEASSGASVNARDLKAGTASVGASSGGSVKYNARTTTVDKSRGIKNYYKD